MPVSDKAAGNKRKIAKENLENTCLPSCCLFWDYVQEEGGPINCKSFSLIPRLAQYCRFSLPAKFNFAIICNLGEYCFYFNIVQTPLPLPAHPLPTARTHIENSTWYYLTPRIIDTLEHLPRVLRAWCLPLSAVEWIHCGRNDHNFCLWRILRTLSRSLPLFHIHTPTALTSLTSI